MMINISRIGQWTEIIKDQDKNKEIDTLIEIEKEEDKENGKNL